MAEGVADAERLRKQEVSAEPNEVLHHFKRGAMGAAKARWHRIVFQVDLDWAKLSDDNDIGNTQVSYDLDLKLGWLQALGGYRVYSKPGGLFGDASTEPGRTFSFDVMSG